MNKVRMLGLAGLVGVITISPVMAQEELYDAAWFRLEVNPLPGKGNYEVIAEPGYANHHIWCWAGNYAQAYLKVPATTRIYLMTPVGPAKTKARRRGVGFTVNPSPEVKANDTRPGQGGNYSISISKVGYNLSIGHTRNFCDLDLGD